MSVLHEPAKAYHLLILALMAIALTLLFGHGNIYLGYGTSGYIGKGLPSISSVEVLHFDAASSYGSKGRSLLGMDAGSFPESVDAKEGSVPACSPFYISILSIPVKWAGDLTPKFDEIDVSSDIEAGKAVWEKGYTRYFHQYKLSVIFFQAPFLILLLLYAYKTLGRLIQKASMRFLLTLGMCFGTLVYPFALTLNPYLPAAALMLCGFYYFLKFESDGKSSDGGAAGMFIGVAFAFHHLAYIPAIAMIIILAIKLREPEKLLPFIGGLIPGIAAFAFFHFSVFGDPLPAIYHQGGGSGGLLVFWKMFIWSIAGFNGALWMSPLIGLALIYALAHRSKDPVADLIPKVLGIAVCVMLLVSALETVSTFEPIINPKSGKTYEDAYSAIRVMSPEIEMSIAGFPMAVGFHTRIFGGEVFAIIGPVLFVLFAGVLAGSGAWSSWGMILLRAGLVIGIFASYNPLGARFFPLVENFHLFAMDIALKLPREMIF